MDRDDELQRTRDHDGDVGHGRTAFGMMAMMGLMMAMCMGSAVLFAIIPFVGLPLGVAIAAVGVAAMLYLHGRMMGHGH